MGHSSIPPIRPFPFSLVQPTTSHLQITVYTDQFLVVPSSLKATLPSELSLGAAQVYPESSSVSGHNWLFWVFFFCICKPSVMWFCIGILVSFCTALWVCDDAAQNAKSRTGALAFHECFREKWKCGCESGGLQTEILTQTQRNQYQRDTTAGYSRLESVL